VNIKSLHKRSAVWDNWFKKPKKTDQFFKVTPTRPPVTVPPAEIKEMPTVTRNPILKERNSSKIIAKFIGRKNWHLALEKNYIQFVNKKRMNSSPILLEEQINEIIKQSLVHVVQEFNLNYVTWAQIPDDVVDGMKTVLARDSVAYIGILGKFLPNKEVPYANKEVSNVLTSEDVKKTLSETISEATKSLSEFLTNSPSFQTQMRSLMVKQQEEWETEKLQRQKESERLKARNEEQIRQQQEVWKEKSGVQPTGSIRLQNVEKALNDRKVRFNAMLDSALTAYAKGVETMRDNPGVFREEAFRDLAIILETRFKTALNFEDMQE